MFGTDMRYLAVSRRFVIDFGLDNESPASLTGRSHYEVFPELPERWRVVHGRVLAGQGCSVEDDQFRRPDGHIERLRWEMVPWRNADGTIGGALLFSERLTDRRMAEAALRDSEARLRLVQRVGRIAWSDRTLSESIARISEEYAQIYGLPPGQTHITRTEWVSLIHPEDRDREWLHVMADSVSQYCGPVAGEFRIVRPDGAVRWISLRNEAFPGPDGEPLRIITAQQDITELVAAREALAVRQQELERRVTERTAALAEAEGRFRGIFDSQFQYISLLAPDGTILEVNRTALDAGGLNRDEAVGKRFWETRCWPDAARDQLRSDIAQASRGTLIRHEVEAISASGRVMRLDFSVKPVLDPVSGGVTSLIAEGRDLTERYNLTAQLVQSQKVQALGQLAGGIAHDFNNILQTVAGAAALIEQEPGNVERTRSRARTAMTAANRGTSITRRLLSFARRGDLRAAVIDTAAMLNNVSEVLAHTLGTSITVSVDVPADVPALIADQSQLETALINLGTNARDAMPDGGTLLLSAKAEHVAEGASHPGLTAGDYVRLSFADTGTGMDAATLARASEPFFTTKALGRGTGLGLAMARGFAEQSGGALSIASAPGRGTTVQMWLRQASGEVSRGRDDLPGARVAGEVSGRILVVDDDEGVRETVADQLEAAGFVSLVAASGDEALALIEAGEAVDAMVSDLSMPGMDGVTTIRKVHALRPQLPCLLLTGYVGERDAWSREVDFTLVRKPVTGPALAALIEAALEGARR